MHVVRVDAGVCWCWFFAAVSWRLAASSSQSICNWRQIVGDWLLLQWQRRGQDKEASVSGTLSHRVIWSVHGCCHAAVFVLWLL